MNKLYDGDNLDILRKLIRDQIFGIYYSSPPPNCKRNDHQIYNEIGGFFDIIQTL